MRDVSSELFLRLLEILKESNIGFFCCGSERCVCKECDGFLLLFGARKSDMDVHRYTQNLAIIVKESGVTSQRKLLAKEVCQASG